MLYVRVEGGIGYSPPPIYLLVPLDSSVPLYLNSNYICEFVVRYTIRGNISLVSLDLLMPLYIDSIYISDYIVFRCVSSPEMIPTVYFSSKSVLDQPCPPFAIV